MNHSLEYYEYILLLLKGYTLVLVQSDNESYIDCIKMKNIPLTDEMANDLVMSGYVELDSGNFDFAEVYYIRKDSWKDDLIKLKIEHPHIFRKNKINKLLKNG